MIYWSESPPASHNARIALLEEQRERANDERIRRLRQSEIKTAEADYARRIRDLDTALERADIIAEPVAYGILNIGE